MGPQIKAAIYGNGRQIGEVAQALGVTRDVLSNVINGRTEPDDDLLDRLRKELRLAKDWPEQAAEPPAQEVSNASAYTKNLKPMPSRKVKIYGTVSAGDGAASQSFDADELQIPTDMSAPDLGALIVEGDSMEPFLEPMDIAIFRDSAEPRLGYVVAAAAPFYQKTPHFSSLLLNQFANQQFHIEHICANYPGYYCVFAQTVR